MSEKRLLVVSWTDCPFGISFSMIGTKEEIYSHAIACKDCTYNCEQEMFVRCVNIAYQDDTLETFTDKYHGLMVCSPDRFDDLDDAEKYVERRFPKYSRYP